MSYHTHTLGIVDCVTLLASRAMGIPRTKLMTRTTCFGFRGGAGGCKGIQSSKQITPSQVRPIKQALLSFTCTSRSLRL